MTAIKYGGGVESAPGVYVREFDQTLTTSPAASTESAIAGVFSWGPVNEPRLISSESELVSTYGRPSNSNFETFFSAANYLAYADKLYVNRVIDATTTFSAYANTVAVVSPAAHTILNNEDYTVKSTSFEPGVQFIGKAPGSLANGLKVSICASPAQYESTIDLRVVSANTLFGSVNTVVATTVGSNTATITLANTAALAANTPMPYATTVAGLLSVGDIITIGNTSIGTQDLKIASIGPISIANTATVNTGIATIGLVFDQPSKIAADFSAPAVNRSWEYRNAVDSAPSLTYSTSAARVAISDAIHAVVVDAAGKFTGRPGAILEVYEGMSRATDSATIEGNGNFFKNVINSNSRYIWCATTPVAITTNITTSLAAITSAVPINAVFVGGTDGTDETTVTVATIGNGYSYFANKDQYSLSSVIVGKTRGGTYGEQIFNHVVDNIAEVRKDIIVYGSPAKSTVVSNSNPLAALTAFRGAMRRSSYAAMDSSYKYQYDKYNDVFRYVPLCGDIAGISARTDVTNDPWISPAGYNRGQIKNIIKLSYNPTSGDQKVLFANDINPVVANSVDGTFLLGDKTLLGQQSAFNSIGVRKLFNILKTNIAKAAKATLFENNDEFSQSRFRNIVDPFLRDVQGRSGVQSYRVVCDDSNNTQQVKNSYQFVGDIYIVPPRSIRTIHLNFVGVNSIPEFNETL